jgi:hypothetical protein
LPRLVSSDCIKITGLQPGATSDLTIWPTSEPVPLRVELESTAEQQASLALELRDFGGVVVFRHTSTVALPAGTCWGELWLPPGALPPGRFFIGLGVEGHDFHRSRHPLEIIASDEAPGSSTSPPPEAWVLRPTHLPRPPLLRLVEQVRIQRAAGGEPLYLTGDEPVRFVVRANLQGLPPGPLLRLQVLAPDGRLLLGTNTDRWEIGLGEGGRRIIEVAYDRLSLRPGHYLVTVGLWPSEESAEPYEARHGYYELLVGEEVGDRPPWLASRLTVRPAADLGEAQGPELTVARPPPSGPGSAGELELELRLQNGVQLAGWVEADAGEVVVRGVVPRVVCQGAAAVTWQVQLSLPSGDYTFCCAAWDERRREPRGTVHRFPLRVPGEEEAR